VRRRVEVEGSEAVPSGVRAYAMILHTLMHGLGERPQVPVRTWLTAAAFAIASHPLDHLPPEGEPARDRPDDGAMEVRQFTSLPMMHRPNRMQVSFASASLSTACTIDTIVDSSTLLTIRRLGRAATSACRGLARSGAQCAPARGRSRGPYRR
jgi:hypothetical protein